MPAVNSLLYLVDGKPGSALDDALATARYFTRNGSRVTVVGPLARLVQEDLTQAGVRWINLPLPDGADLASWLRVARRLSRLHAAEPAEVVHCQGLLPGLAAALALFRHRETALVIAPGTTLPGGLSPLMKALAEWSLRQAQALVVPTVTEREVLLETYPRLAEAVQIVPRAVEVKALSGDFDAGMKRLALGVNPQTAVVGVIGPARRAAGLVGFLEAAQAISHDFPNVEFLLVGDGVDLEELKLQVHDMGLSGATVFRANRPDTAEIIASLNILVIPYETPEAMQYALQALTHDIPLVAVPAPSLVEILGDLCPEAFVPAGDVPQLVAALARNLELLPEADANGEAFVEGGLMLNYADLLVSRDSYDLDQAGLQADDRRESPRRQAAQRAVARYGTAAMLRATERLYVAALAHRSQGGRQGE